MLLRCRINWCLSNTGALAVHLRNTQFLELWMQDYTYWRRLVCLPDFWGWQLSQEIGKENTEVPSPKPEDDPLVGVIYGVHVNSTCHACWFWQGPSCVVLVNFSSWKSMQILTSIVQQKKIVCKMCFLQCIFRVYFFSGWKDTLHSSLKQTGFL